MSACAARWAPASLTVFVFFLLRTLRSSPEQAEAARDHRKMEFTKGDGGGHADDDAARETLLCMYGLPYQVTAAEVEGFFGGYGFVAGSVVLDVDASGKPQGTGQVSMRRVLL